jgi:predicted alpha/beta hydrolase
VLRTPLGYNLSYKTYLHPEAKKLVLIASATGVVKDFYKHFATYLQEQGVSVICFDYGGIGRSKPISLKAFSTSVQRWATNDLESMILYCRSTFPEKELVLLGHSIGGQLIGMAPSAKEAAKVVLVGVQSGYYKFWPLGERIKMLFAWKVLFPIFNASMGFIPTKMFTAMEDLPGGMAMEWKRWCLSPNYLFDHVNPEHLYFDRLNVPLVSFSTEKDKFASKESTDWITARFSAAEVNRIHLLPEDYGVKYIGHFGYFQKRCSHSVWPVLLEQISYGSAAS